MIKNWNIKKLFKELLIGILILFILSNLISYLRKPDLENNRFPQTKTKLIDGKYFETDKVKGKPLLVYFWSINCPACKLEAPNIQEVSTNYEVLTIAVQSGSDEALNHYMKKNGFNFRLINDRYGLWAEEFKIGAFPTIFIYDNHGELSFTEVGFTSTAGLLLRLKMSKNN